MYIFSRQRTGTQVRATQHAHDTTRHETTRHTCTQKTKVTPDIRTRTSAASSTHTETDAFIIRETFPSSPARVENCGRLWRKREMNRVWDGYNANATTRH